jgi:hypothetical protein
VRVTGRRERTGSASRVGTATCTTGWVGARESSAGADTLRAAQADPDAHRDLIVRVAGYSDYFCDLSRELQDEIIACTEHGEI